MKTQPPPFGAPAKLLCDFVGLLRVSPSLSVLGFTSIICSAAAGRGKARLAHIGWYSTECYQDIMPLARRKKSELLLAGARLQNRLGPAIHSGKAGVKYSAAL